MPTPATSSDEFCSSTKLHIDQNADPVAVHKPVPVPIHWMKDLNDQLDMDVRLGVIEKVPIGEPVTWCHRLVLTPKKDGSPRRTVDLQALNRKSVRQTHFTDSPFNLAISVPKKTVRTVLDT